MLGLQNVVRGKGKQLFLIGQEIFETEEKLITAELGWGKPKLYIDGMGL